MASILVPIFYVIIVFGSLFIFSHFYRKQLASKGFEPYFPSHPERNAYVTLLGRSDPPTHDALLKSALLRRAIADVGRVLKLREDKPALQALLQKGSIGDDLWNSLLAAEKELEGEIMEVVAEANTFVEGWGAVIFQTANEMIVNEKLRSVFERTDETRQEYQKRYERKQNPQPTPSLSITEATATETPAPGPSTPATATPALPTTPQAAAKSLVSPLKAPMSAASSDAESVASPTSPRSPSTPSGKKTKKRK